MSIENDIELLLMTEDFAQLSKDRSTKVGCMVFNEGEETPKSFGYNGLPRGLDDNNEERTLHRPEKYFWAEHAERNTIYNVARKLMENSVIFCSHFPNMESARAIVSSDIPLVVVDYDQDFHAEYLKLRKLNLLDSSPEHKNYDRVQQLFRECNVKIYHPSRKLVEDGYFSNRDEAEFSKIKKYITYLDIAKKYGKKFAFGKEKAAGALILDQKTYSPISFGAYGPPHKFILSEDKKNESQYWMIDAEKNAIFNAVRPLLKNSTFYASLCPCMDCALAIVAVNAKKVVTKKPEFITEVELRWKESFNRSQVLFKESGTETVYLTENQLNPKITAKKVM